MGLYTSFLSANAANGLLLVIFALVYLLLYTSLKNQLRIKLIIRVCKESVDALTTQSVEA